MKLDLSIDQTIKLKRHDKKKWSHGDKGIQCVEVATLDYLADYGFNGYFTEREHYLELLIALLGWPGSVPKKLNDAFINCRSIYYNTCDGWLPIYDFSISEVMKEVDSCTRENLLLKIKGFHMANSATKGIYIDSRQDHSRIISFLETLGMDSLRMEVGKIFNYEEFLAKKDIYNFDQRINSCNWKKKVREINERGSADTKGPHILRSYKDLFNFSFHPRSKGWEDNANITEEIALEIDKPRIRQRLLSIVAFARHWRERSDSSYDTTTLDLQLWDKQGTYLAEVKAPGDRLSNAQRTTIERERSSGRPACLITVLEL